MHPRILLALLLAALLCTGTAAAQAGRLQLAGSTTMAPLLVEVAKRYQALHPQAQVDVQMGGSGRGISDVREGKVDIGMVSRTLSDSERDLNGIPIARDGVAVIIHKDNPVNELSSHQLQDIYSGKINNWRQVGGRDAPIQVLGAATEGGSSELFGHYLQIPYEQLKVVQRIGPNAERIAAVAANANAIIYVSLGEAERKVRSGTPVKLLMVDGVAATSKNVRSNDYPIARALTLVTRGTPTGPVRAFIEFCVSSQITDLILTFNYVPYLD